jgi:hypothetical protein
MKIIDRVRAFLRSPNRRPPSDTGAPPSWTHPGTGGRADERPTGTGIGDRTEPGATEVRTLAAYLNALGGRLEIIADLGTERVILG